MQAVSIGPARTELRAMMIGLCLLSVQAVVFPALNLLAALLLPLLTCPLVKRKQEPAAWMAVCMPALGALLAGDASLYAAALGLLGLLPMAVTRALPVAKRTGLAGALWYMSAEMVGLTACAAALGQWFGGPLAQTLPKWVCEWIAQDPQRDELLYQLGASGLLRFPEGYRAAGGLRTAWQAQQMLMSLRLTLESLVETLLPSGFVQAAMLAGLFAMLRVQRLNNVLLVVKTSPSGEKKASVSAPPGFRMLELPQGLRWPLLALALGGMGMILSGDPAWQTAGHMFYALFETAFMLVGAAVVVFRLTARDEDRRMLAGVLAALLFVMTPVLLFVIGMTDSLFRYRSPRPDKQA